MLSGLVVRSRETEAKHGVPWSVAESHLEFRLYEPTAGIRYW